MRSVRALIGVIIALFSSCSGADYSDTLTEKAVKIQQMDSAQVSSEKHLMGGYIGPFANNGMICLPDAMSTQVHLVDNKGSYKYLINPLAVERRFLPPGLPNCAYFLKESVLLYYASYQMIYEVGFDGSFIGKVELKGLAPHLAFSTNFFAYSPSHKMFYLSIQPNSSELKAYQKLPCLAVFDTKGQHQRTFGEYPSYHTEGYIFTTQDFSAVLQGDEIYLHFAFENVIKVFGLDGKLITEHKVFPKDITNKIAFLKEPARPSSSQYSAGFYGLQVSLPYIYFLRRNKNTQLDLHWFHTEKNAYGLVEFPAVSLVEAQDNVLTTLSFQEEEIFLKHLKLEIE